MNTAIANRGDLNVLIVDDEPLIQKLIKSVMLSMGIHKVDVTENGQAGLQAAQSKQRADTPYDVIICDWDMPIMDGIAFMDSFRKTGGKAVIIMVTARTSTTDFNEAKQKGVDYFFMKPLEVNMLRIRLGAAMDAAAARR